MTRKKGKFWAFESLTNKPFTYNYIILFINLFTVDKNSTKKKI